MWNFGGRDKHRTTEASSIKKEFLNDVARRQHANDIVISPTLFADILYNGKTYT
jgi:hypothetical protein